MRFALDETNRRRERQRHFNEVNGITPVSIQKDITDVLETVCQRDEQVGEVEGKKISNGAGHNYKTVIAELEINESCRCQPWLRSTRLRDEIRRMENTALGLTFFGTPLSSSKSNAFPAGTPGAPVKRRRKRK